MATTNQPSNGSELQLYRVLQRANLLQYYDTFISQGGDDVQQLCEAGEDEFLEIMALVGMASKPLHVRRLQKALQEWVANPAAFEGNARKSFPTHVMSMTGTGPQTITSSLPVDATPPRSAASTASVQDYKVRPPQSSAISTSTPWSNQTVNGTGGVSPSQGSSRDQPSPTDSQEEDFKDVLYQTDGPGGYSSLVGMGQPALMEHQITAIATAAAILAQELPPFEPKSMPKKQISKEIHAVMTMTTDDPRKMDAMRKYAAIYGRFDSKRKNDRPMSLHEISVNEAAAQLCSHFPPLLTRREELFPLARQVVRDSGYQYSKGHSRAAEIVVPPKTEPSSDASNSLPSSSPASTPIEDQYTRAQTELLEVTETLSELAKEQDRIRSALRVLLEANDHQQMRTLTAEMDNINDQYAALTSRRQELVSELARMRRNTSRMLQIPGTSCPEVSYSPPDMSSKLASINLKYSGSSGNSSSSTGSALFHSTSNNPLNTLYMAALQNNSDSLIEEGLRIATQYGMADFAQELIGMKNNEIDTKTTIKSTAKTNANPNEEKLVEGAKTEKKDLKDESTSFAATTATTTTTTITAKLDIAIPSPTLLTTSLSSAFTSSPLPSAVTSSPVILTTKALPGVNISPPMPTNFNTPTSHTGSRSSSNQGKSPVKDFQFSPGRVMKLPTMASPINTDTYIAKSNRCNNTINAKSSISPPAAPHINVTDKINNTINTKSRISPSAVPHVTAYEGIVPSTCVKKEFPSTPPHSISVSTPETVAISLDESLPSKPMETETRRSSRRRTNDPDYYLINGGEKRFRSFNSRRSSSTSSECASKITSSPPSPSPTAMTLMSGVKAASLSPSSNAGIGDSSNGGYGTVQGNAGNASSIKKAERKPECDKSLDDSESDHWSMDGITETEESLDPYADGEKRVGRRKRSQPAVSYTAFK